MMQELTESMIIEEIISKSINSVNDWLFVLLTSFVVIYLIIWIFFCFTKNKVTVFLMLLGFVAILMFGLPLYSDAIFPQFASKNALETGEYFIAEDIISSKVQVENIKHRHIFSYLFLENKGKHEVSEEDYINFKEGDKIYLLIVKSKLGKEYIISEYNANDYYYENALKLDLNEGKVFTNGEKARFWEIFKIVVFWSVVTIGIIWSIYEEYKEKKKTKKYITEKERKKSKK